MTMSARLILRLGVCLTIGISLEAVSSSAVGTGTPRERRFEFDYVASVKDIPAGAKTVDLWIPVPHDSEFQKITDLKIDSPYPYHISPAQYGNTMLHITLMDPKQSSFQVTMWFNTLRKEHIQERLQQHDTAAVKDPRDPDMARWLKPDRLVPIDGKGKQRGQGEGPATRAKTQLGKRREDRSREGQSDLQSRGGNGEVRQERTGLGPRRHLLRLRRPEGKLHRLSRDRDRLLPGAGNSGAIRDRFPPAFRSRGRSDKLL